jgi:hypothetical protein
MAAGSHPRTSIDTAADLLIVAGSITTQPALALLTAATAWTAGDKRERAHCSFQGAAFGVGANEYWRRNT